MSDIKHTPEPTGFDAEFLSKRLGLVCQRLGITQPFGDNHESNAAVAGTTLAAVDRAIDSLIKQRDELLAALGTQAAKDVIAERQRQINVEGWTPEHDDQHKAGDLARAAGLYASNAGAAMHFWTTDTSICDTAPYGWPWAPEFWKPNNSRRDLVKAGALIFAEIERIDRSAIASVKGGAA